MFTAKQNLIKEDGDLVHAGTEGLKPDDIGRDEVIERFLKIGAIELEGEKVAAPGDETETATPGDPTEAQLKKMNRDKLVEIAKGKDLPVADEDTKAELIAKILEPAKE